MSVLLCAHAPSTPPPPPNLGPQHPPPTQLRTTAPLSRRAATLCRHDVILCALPITAPRPLANQRTQLWPEISRLKGRTGYSGQKGREAPLSLLWESQSRVDTGCSPPGGRGEGRLQQGRGGREWPCGRPALRPRLQHLCGWVTSLHKCA